MDYESYTFRDNQQNDVTGIYGIYHNYYRQIVFSFFGFNPLLCNVDLLVEPRSSCETIVFKLSVCVGGGGGQDPFGSGTRRSSYKDLNLTSKSNPGPHEY